MDNNKKQQQEMAKEEEEEELDPLKIVEFRLRHHANGNKDQDEEHGAASRVAANLPNNDVLLSQYVNSNDNPYRPPPSSINVGELPNNHNGCDSSTCVSSVTNNSSHFYFNRSIYPKAPSRSSSSESDEEKDMFFDQPQLYPTSQEEGTEAETTACQQEEKPKMTNNNGKDAGTKKPKADMETHLVCAPVKGKIRAILAQTSIPAVTTATTTALDRAPRIRQSRPGAFAQPGSQARRSNIEHGATIAEQPNDDISSGLVVANLVADSNGSDFPVAEAVDSDPDSQPLCYSNTQIKKVGCAAATLILGGAVIFLVFLLQGDSKPIQLDDDPPEQRAQQLLHALLPYSTLEIISNITGSPQALAYNFLLQDPSLFGYPDWRIRQRFALATFFHSTGGSEWRKNTSWLDYSVHECDWYARPTFGINYNSMIHFDHMHPCGDNPTGMYKHLWLWNNGLVGTIPEELSWLPDLKTISIYFNNFTGSSIPSSLGLLTSLIGINIGKSGLAGPIPQGVAKIPNLEALVLMENKLTGTIPSQLGSVANLSLVVLEHNDLSGTIPTVLSLCKNLVGMWLNGNRLMGSIPSELGLLPMLYFLDLSLNHLTSTIPLELGRLPLITRIILPCNQLTGTIPSELGSLSTMTNLMVQNNYLTGSVPTQIGLMTNLDRLLLFNNTLTGPIPSEVGLLAKTTELDVFSNQFLGPIPSQLGLMTNMIELVLSNNLLSGTVPSEMDILPDLKLRILHIHGNDGLSGVLPESFCSMKEFFFNCSDSLCGCICDC